ncbi:MAG: DUF1330 domain-containing protein [Rhodobacteraceae bacterium]|nr:DUF1330 domain-containing protein [Paracoccaceae bacterium]
MAKGYWIVNMTVEDAAAFGRYKEANAAPLAEYGGRFLVRGGTQEVPEGEARPRTSVVEFPSIAAARDCYNSPGYRTAIDVREGAAVMDFVIVEGYDG